MVSCVQETCNWRRGRLTSHSSEVAAWLTGSGSASVSINGVTLRRAWLILGWVTVYG